MPVLDPSGFLLIDNLRTKGDGDLRCERKAGFFSRGGRNAPEGRGMDVLISRCGESRVIADTLQTVALCIKIEVKFLSGLCHKWPFTTLL